MRQPNIWVMVIFVGALLMMSVVAQSNDLIINSAERVELNGAKIWGTVLVDGTGELRVKLTSLSDPDTGILSLVANQIEVRSGGRINGSDAIGRVWPNPLENQGGVGGGYGGRGGAPTSEQQELQRGSVEQPLILQGSSGGDGPGHVRFGGVPGGALTLRGATIVIDGTVEANGHKGEDWSSNLLDGPEPERYFGGGGGSGGGILIIAKHLTIGPNAKITANGGDGGDGRGSSCWEGYPGGGGRIKIFYEEGTISESAVIEAKAGTRPVFEPGACGGDGGVEDGTVHIQQVKSVDQLLNPGDVNGDGKTDHEDLFLIYQSWQKEVTPVPTAQPMPTP